MSRRSRFISRPVIPAVLGAGAAIIAFVVWSGAGGAAAKFLLAAVLLVPLLAASVLLHEAGHMLGGRIAGMRPEVLVVGPLSVSFRDGRPAGLGWHGMMPGGLAVCSPSGRRTLKSQLIALVLGGPLTSLGLGVVGLTAALSGELPGAWPLVAGLFGGINLLVFALTAIPASPGGLATDGARFVGLVAETPVGTEFMRTFRRTALLFAPERPSKWPLSEADLTREVDTAAPGSLEKLAALIMLLYWHLDHGDMGAAGAVFETAVRSVPEALAPTLGGPFFLELATFALLFDNRLDRARALRARAGANPMLTDPHLCHFYEGALAAREGRMDARDAAFAQSRKDMARAISRGSAALHEILIGRIERSDTMPLGAIRFSREENPSRA